MATKKCFKCEKILELKYFYKHPRMLDGHLNKCKECAKADVRQNRKDNIDYYIEYEKNRANLPHRVEARANYVKTNNGKAAINRSSQKWKESNLIKRSASCIVNNAVRDGKLFKPKSCSECGKTNVRIHGHHDDYAYPMIVRWLCAKCHNDWHKVHGSGLNG